MALENECRLDFKTQEFVASINKFNLETRNFKMVKSKTTKQPCKKKLIVL